MKKILLFMLLIPFALCGCKKSGSSSSEPEHYINVPTSEVSLEVEETYQLDVEIIKKGTIVFYSSANEDIATVTDEGLITAINEGETTISVRGGQDVYTVFVNVIPYQAKDSLQIVLEKEEFVIEVNDEYILPLTVKYGNEIIENPSLSYTYENEGVVSIVGNVVTGLKEGETRCVVTASYEQKEVSKSFKITVY